MPAYAAGSSPPSLSHGDVGFAIGFADNNSNHATIAASPTGASRTTNVVTITTSANHNFQVNQIVEIQGVVSVGATNFNGKFTIASVPSATTFTYSQTAANDSGGGGEAISKVTEAIPALNASSQQFAICDAPGIGDQGRAVRWAHSYNVNPGAITVVLQGADIDADAAYTQIDTDSTVGGNSKMVTGVVARFLRIKVTALTLGSGAGMLARIEV